jgi:2,4-dienoyl-CoA reductase-like NADH-dependent reductase (Old Yellow Enzyme family)/thioredoxin reductase
MYSFLQPIKVGNLLLKNRIIYASMCKYMCDDEGNLTNQYYEYYRNLAKGGVALITPGAMVIDPEWPFRFPRQPWLNDDRFIPGLKKLVDIVHAEGALIAFQLWHPGESTTDPDNKPKTVNELTLEEIKKIQRQYVEAARRSKEAGADAVEFHIAHNYLPSQFMSPYFNKRTDEYGCSTVENSMRFSTECIRAIKEELGEDFTVTAKINGSDFVEGGITPDLAAKAAVYVEKAGAAMITVNGGGSLTLREGMSADGNKEEGWKISFAERVKQAVSIPVAGSGNIVHPEFADLCLKQGKCDIIAIGRGFVAEPEWVKKAMTGREKEIRKCIACMYCFTKNPLGTSGCSVNPYSKREYEKPELIKNGNGRTIAVAGAGPAGLECAVVLAERGFKPVIYDSSPVIGGMLVVGSEPPGKQKIKWMIEYYEDQIKRLNIEFHPNTEVDAELLEKLNPYAIVVATGSNEFVPPIEGIDSPNVITVRDILANHSGITNRKIAVLGGGMTGLEAARMLRLQNNDVTVLEMMPPKTNPSFEEQLALKYALKDGVVVLFENKAEKIEEKSVCARQTKTGETVKIPADIVVLSLGIVPDNSLFIELKGKFNRVYCIGDSQKAGKIVDAVSAGADLGHKLD